MFVKHTVLYSLKFMNFCLYFLKHSIKFLMPVYITIYQNQILTVKTRNGIIIQLDISEQTLQVSTN